MKELRTIIRALHADPGPAVLATLVDVEGSSYRRTGARLLWRAGRARLGAISGGCLEEDLAARCQAVLTTGRAETVVYDTSGEHDQIWGVGLGCHGVVHVLVERIDAAPAWMRFVEAAWGRGSAAVLAIRFRGERLGAECAVAEGGGQWSARGDGDGETISAALLALARERLARADDAAGGGGAARARRAPSIPPAVEALASGAPGADPRSAPTASAADIFFEYLPPPTRLAIFGAGDDAQPLARAAAGLGWSVSVVDPRGAFATRARFPEAEDVVVAAPERAVAEARLDRRSLAVVMTHHYVHDVPLLRALLPLPLAYLGLLGPKKRADKILGELAAEGVALPPESRARLHAPVGLDLGADAPEEVALAILAEMLATLRRRDASPLRARTRPIHDA